MLSGLFAVEFIANNNQFGAGIVVISEGTINGGDLSYLYQGHFEYYEQEIKASIEVRHYSGQRNAVMGPLNNFTLILSGRFSEGSFSVTGGIPNMPNLRITINGRKIAELYE